MDEDTGHLGLTAFGGGVTTFMATGFVREPRIPIRDNSGFIDIFDKTTFERTVKSGARKTVVVDQDPDPGTFVPLGTPINLIVTVKATIPLGSFKGISTKLAGKYPTIGHLTDALDEGEVGKDAKVVLDKDVDYDSLSDHDKTAVDKFIAGVGDGTVDKKKVYNDMKFLHKL